MYDTKKRDDHLRKGEGLLGINVEKCTYIENVPCIKPVYSSEIISVRTTSSRRAFFFNSGGNPSGPGALPLYIDPIDRITSSGADKCDFLAESFKW